MVEKIRPDLIQNWDCQKNYFDCKSKFRKSIFGI